MRGRELDGILLLDKPTGISSNRALQKAARLYEARKAGHTGSLDPLASGMLPICFGEATKISAFLLDSDKAYTVTAQLGVTTDTCDADGEVLTRQAVTVSDDLTIERALSRFRGDIDQVPPMYSALKHKGQRLYKLARKGQEVERKPRRVHIAELTLLKVDGDAVTLHVQCSKGTYIRSLVVDIGETLGCGAHVTQLRRDWVNPFADLAMHTLERLESLADAGDSSMDALLLPLDAGLNLPKIVLDPESGARLLMGQVVDCADALETADLYRVYNEELLFLGIGKCSLPGKLAPKRLIRTYFDQK